MEEQQQGPAAATPARPEGETASGDSSRYVTRDEFESRVKPLESHAEEGLTVEAPQPDAEVTASTAAALGLPDPGTYDDDNHAPEGPVDPHGRSDGTGLATEGNKPVPAEHKGFFRGF